MGRLLVFRQKGAHLIDKRILVLYRQHGGDVSPLAYPVTHNAFAPDGVGMFSRFEHGTIYWHPDTGAEVLQPAPSQASWSMPRASPPLRSQRPTEVQTRLTARSAGVTPSESTFRNRTTLGIGRRPLSVDRGNRVKRPFIDALLTGCWDRKAVADASELPSRWTHRHSVASVGWSRRPLRPDDRPRAGCP